MTPQFDVFFSHRSQDKPAIRQIATALGELGLKVWLDESELQPGKPWQEAIEKAIEASLAIAVFIGPDGFGPWEMPEMRSALEEQVRRPCPVIPVLLPGVPDEINLPLFLKRNTWIDFRHGLEDQDTIDRLYWGITGKKRDRKDTLAGISGRIVPVPRRGPVDEAIANLGESFRSGNATFLLGTGASQGDQNLPPSACEITHELFVQLELIDRTYTQLLPPVDIAATYYVLKAGERILEDVIVRLIIDRSKRIPATHQKLAKLLILLATRPAGRVRRKKQQLIVTTNLDVMMERALLQSGLSFTRIVHYRSAERIAIDEYRGVVLLGNNTVQLQSKQGPPRTAQLNDLNELDELIRESGWRTIHSRLGEGASARKNPLRSLSLEGLTEPILYKLRGSQDIPDSCTISSDQYFEFTRRVLSENVIPNEIREIISNTPVLFLGYGFLEPDFRLTYHALLRNSDQLTAFEPAKEWRYAVQPPPDMEGRDIYRQMELKIWDSVKAAALRMGITMVEEQSEVFLQMLLDRISADIARA